MSVTRIAPRYAKSLIELAVEQNKLDKIKEDINAFLEVSKVRDFALMMKSPIINATKKAKIFKALFEGKFDELTLAFLNILLKKSREEHMPEIAHEFIAQYKVLKHITTVKLTSAAPLSQEAEGAILQKLTECNTTDNKIELITAVNPKLIGGYILEYDDQVYDASVFHKLEQLKKEFVDNEFVSRYVAR